MKGRALLMNAMFAVNVMVLLGCVSCVPVGLAGDRWKSVCCLNAASNDISVISVQGIQAFARGSGPQDLGFGNVAATGIKSVETRNRVYIRYPVVIRWVERALEDPSEGSAEAKMVEIHSFEGLPPSAAAVPGEASLVLVYTGSKWRAFYIEGEPGAVDIEKAIRALLASRRADP